MCQASCCPSYDRVSAVPQAQVDVSISSAVQLMATTSAAWLTARPVAAPPAVPPADC
jgi:hypothetical protein